jgi:hypothetical protein
MSTGPTATATRAPVLITVSSRSGHLPNSRSILYEVRPGD